MNKLFISNFNTLVHILNLFCKYYDHFVQYYGQWNSKYHETNTTKKWRNVPAVFLTLIAPGPGRGGLWRSVREPKYFLDCLLS